MKVLGLVAALVLAACAAHAQTRGFVEPFESGSVVSSWWGYADTTTTWPEWGGTTDRYAYQTFAASGYLYANGTSSDGNVVGGGDYSAARVGGLAADVYWPPGVQTPWLYLKSGLGTNYLAAFSAGLAPGTWHRFEAGFGAEWYNRDTATWEVPDTNDLAHVQFVGVYAESSPAGQAGGGAAPAHALYVAIDRFTVYPELVRPRLERLEQDGSTQTWNVTFDTEPDQVYTLDARQDLTAQDWSPVPAYCSMPGTGHSVTVTVSEAGHQALYRIRSEAFIPALSGADGSPAGAGDTGTTTHAPSGCVVPRSPASRLTGRP